MTRDWPRLALLLIGLLAIASSASAPKQHSIDRSRKFDDSFNHTWSAVIDVFADRNWAIANMDKDSGLIATDWMTLGPDSEHADCGGSGIASVVNRHVRFNVRVRDHDGGTRVTVNASFREIRTLDGSQAGVIECTSRGSVEALIHDLVAAALERSVKNTRKRERPKPDGELGGSCYGNGTCDEGLSCDEGNQCREQQAMPTGALGGACYGNGTCNSGLSCDTGREVCVDSEDATSE